MGRLAAFPEGKVFHGKTYHLVGGTRTLKEARELAKRTRAKGDLVEIYHRRGRVQPRYLVYHRWPT